MPDSRRDDMEWLALFGLIGDLAYNVTAREVQQWHEDAGGD